MSNQQALAERRKQKRIDKKIVLRVASPEGAATQWTVVTTRNISTSGILFVYDRALAEGTPIFVKMHISGRIVDCKGVVQRASRGRLEPLMDVAASIEGLDESEKRLIERNS
jgi:hypothetical protein